MPPQKPRVANHEDTFPASKEKAAMVQPAISRLKKNGSSALTNGTTAKDTAPGAVVGHVGAVGDTTQQNGSASGLTWPSEELETLHAYRHAYRLDTPTGFKNPLGHVLLQTGIGQYSPTMARRRQRRRVNKDQLALAVRKNFNSLAVNETEVIVNLLYKVKSQDKTLRARFAPNRR